MRSLKIFLCATVHLGEAKNVACTQILLASPWEDLHTNISRFFAFSAAAERCAHCPWEFFQRQFFALNRWRLRQKVLRVDTISKNGYKIDSYWRINGYEILQRNLKRTQRIFEGFFKRVEVLIVLLGIFQKANFSNCKFLAEKDSCHNSFLLFCIWKVAMAHFWIVSQGFVPKGFSSMFSDHF